MKNFAQRYMNLWPAALVVVAAAGLLLYRLTGLTAGSLSPLEQQTIGDWPTFGSILELPLNAPYATVGLALDQLLPTITAWRLASVLFAVAAAGLFYSLASQWYGRKIGILASLLFIVSGWFLHVGRQATPDILWITGILLLIRLLVSSKTQGRLQQFIRPAGLIVLLYIPAMVWPLAIALAMSRRRSNTKPTLTLAGSLIAGAVAVPLIWAVVHSPELLTQWFGFTAGFDPIVMLKNLVAVPRDLFLAAYFGPGRWIDGLPLLTIFEAGLLVAGIILYVMRLKTNRARLLLGLGLLGSIIVAISGVTAVSMIIPIVYLVAAAGLAYLLHVWLKVFPSNPLARALGTGLIIAAVALTGTYHLRSYFVAWHYSPETKAYYRQ